jgi:hypothetical protein
VEGYLCVTIPGGQTLIENFIEDQYLEILSHELKATKETKEKAEELRIQAECFSQ